MSKKKRMSSANKEDLVMRVLRGEDLETVSRESGVAMHLLQAWRDTYTRAGRESLKAKPGNSVESELERQIKQQASEIEILKKSEGARGRPEVVMQLCHERSEVTGKVFAIEPLCRLCEVPRSSFYEYARQLRHQRRAARRERAKPGPKVQVDDAQLLATIKDVLAASPFHTEGTKKVHARLRRKGIRACRERVNRVMRAAGLLSPQRTSRDKRQHTGSIIPEMINRLWGADATTLSTATGERLWLFAVIDHYSDEVLGWHIVPVGHGTRWAALEPIKQAVRKIFGRIDKGICQNLGLRHDWGPQYAAKDFAKELAYLGITNSPGFEHEPETNGVIERFFRTAKDNCLWIEHFTDLQHARQRVAAWIEDYNTQWLIGRLGNRSPREVRQEFASREASAEVA